MGLIKDLNRIYKSGKSMYTRTKKSKPKQLVLTEVIEGASLFAGEPDDNMLIRGDNRNVMASLLADEKISGKIKLIYTDPPFFSMADYDAVLKAGKESLKHGAYRDNWSKGMAEYLKMLTCRIIMMRDLLADDGLIFIHLDWHAVHYVKAIMDEVFGSDNFVNEIIWNYKSGGSSKKRFSRKHDNILVYSKTSKYKFYPQSEKSYNRDYKPYRFKGVEEFRDELGWYTMVNMKDVWQIDMVGRTSGERTGYATQKPEALLERIIKSATQEGDICADFFAGSGTLAAAASKLGRRFIIADSGRLAAETASARLIKEGVAFSAFDEKIPKNSGLAARVLMSSDGNEDGAVKDVKISIEKIRLTGDFKRFEENEEKIKKIVSEDPMSLVLSWSIDFDYDGKVHRPDRIFVRENDKIETECRHLVSSGGSISLKITDIFGDVKMIEL